MIKNYLHNQSFANYEGWGRGEVVGGGGGTGIDKWAWSEESSYIVDIVSQFIHLGGSSHEELKLDMIFFFSNCLGYS